MNEIGRAFGRKPAHTVAELRAGLASARASARQANTRQEGSSPWVWLFLPLRRPVDLRSFFFKAIFFRVLP